MRLVFGLLVAAAALACDFSAVEARERLAGEAIGSGRLSEARKILRAVVDGSETCGESALPLRTRAIMGLAGLERVLGHPKEGLAWARRAVTLAETSQTAQLQADALHTLAQLLAAAGKFYDAEPAIQRALEIWQREGGDHGVEMASCLNTLAVLHLALADPGGARRHLRRALTYGRASGADLAVAGTLHALATVEWQEGRSQESLSLLDEARVLAERALGPGHPYLANLLASYSRVLSSLHRKAEARQYRDRAKSLTLMLDR